MRPGRSASLYAPEGDRVSHGTSFLAPGSLARRRLARVSHHHHQKNIPTHRHSKISNQKQKNPARWCSSKKKEKKIMEQKKLLCLVVWRAVAWARAAFENRKKMAIARQTHATACSSCSPSAVRTWVVRGPRRLCHYFLFVCLWLLGF